MQTYTFQGNSLCIFNLLKFSVINRNNLSNHKIGQKWHYGLNAKCATTR